MEDLEIICDDEKIGCRLMKMGIMSKDQVDAVTEKQNKGDHRLFGEIAIELGYIDESALLKYLEANK